jgi:cytochrome c biogenesis factor
MQEKEEQSLVQEFEHFTDHIIPYLVILLAVVLVLENPFWTLVHLENYEPWITIFDGVVVFFFVVDLVFKWFKTRNVRKFFQLYWLDLLAVFPFYLAFRAYAEVAAVFRVGEELSETGQKLAHEAVLLREARMFREAEELAKEARFARTAGREIRLGQRLLRAFKGRFYTSHRMLVAVHEQHKRDHRKMLTAQQSRRARQAVRARN